MKMTVFKPGHIIFFVLSAFLFTNCIKDNDAVDPDIVITSPKENQVFNVFDTLFVKASVTSRDKLTGLMVGVVDENLQPVLPTYNISLNTTLVNHWEINQPIPIDAITLESGNYYLWIKASTDHTIKNKYLSIRIIEAERKIKKIILLQRSNLNTTTLIEMDSSLQPLHCFDFAQDLQAADIDPVHSMLYLIGSVTGILTAFNLDSNRVEWQQSGSGTPELNYYQDIRLHQSLALASSSNGRIIGYDHQGNIDFYKDFGFVQYPVRNWIHENIITIAVEQKNGSPGYLNNYYYPGSAYQSGIQIPFTIISILPVTNDIMLIAGNQSDEGIIRYFTSSAPGLSTPCNFPSETIRKVIPGSDGNFFINTGEKIYWFQSSQNSITPYILADQGIVDLVYDITNNHILTVESSTLNFYSFPQHQLLHSVTVDDSVKACLLWYNK
jgi:hypothetical protein